MNNLKTKPSVSQRNYGIDLLRLLAAFYVIVLHTLNQGGICNAVTADSHQDHLCRFLMIASICAVNIFGIISGYIGYRDREKTAPLSGFLSLWLCVVFYSVSICAVYRFLLPGTVTGSDLMTMFFPLSKRLYWYFGAYTLVYFLSPHLNRLLQLASVEEARKCFWLVCLVVVPLEYLGNTFAMGSGYSASWLICLYLIGAMMKKCEIGSKVPSIFLFLGILATHLCYFWLNTKLLHCSIFLFHLSFRIDSSYVSPFYLIPAMLYVMLFSRFSFREPVQKIIAFSAPAVFFVYIINVQPQFWQYFMHNRFAPWALSSPAGIVIRVLGFSGGFVAAVVIADSFRRKLFRLLGIPRILQKIAAAPRKSGQPLL